MSRSKISLLIDKVFIYKLQVHSSARSDRIGTAQFDLLIQAETSAISLYYTFQSTF